MRRLLGMLYLIVAIPAGRVYAWLRPGNKDGLH